jgi:hypothetical protein
VDSEVAEMSGHGQSQEQRQKENTMNPHPPLPFTDPHSIIRGMADRHYLGLANEPRPEPPGSDDATSAREVMNFTVDRCMELTDAIYVYANARFEEAPIASCRTLELMSALVSEVVLWVRRWPN